MLTDLLNNTEQGFQRRKNPAVFGGDLTSIVPCGENRLSLNKSRLRRRLLPVQNNQFSTGPPAAVTLREVYTTEEGEKESSVLHTPPCIRFSPRIPRPESPSTGLTREAVTAGGSQVVAELGCISSELFEARGPVHGEKEDKVSETTLDSPEPSDKLPNVRGKFKKLIILWFFFFVFFSLQPR